MPLTLRSPAFVDGSPIPARHGCDGDDVSPALAWSGAPDGTASFALVVQDPDAPDPAKPERIFTHWVLYDLPVASGGLPENVAPDTLPAGSRAGHNDWKRGTWGGPCPPVGRHRYCFKLFALDTQLGDIGTPTRQELERALDGHIIETAELMGTYERPTAKQRH